MKNDALIRVYTQPLFDLAVESKSVDAIAAEVEALSIMFEQVPVLEEYLDNPNVTRTAKLDLIKKAYDKPLSKYFSRYLDLVLLKGRQEILPFAWKAFLRYWDEYRSLLKVSAVTTVELTKKQKQAIEKKLQKRTGKNIILECKIDPSIIGGLRLHIGNLLLDSTIAGRLASLKKQLI